METTVRAATEGERERATDALVLAFTGDPFCRWLWPEPEMFLDGWKRMIGPFGGKAFDQGTAWVTDGLEAAALWLGPGVEGDDEAMAAILVDTVAPERMEEVGTLLEAMDEAHPKYDHWYLPIIGCDPAHIGNGLGGALMRHALERVDETGLPAYLESSNPRNISLYLRHGFEISGEIRIEDSPPLTPMTRPVR